MKLGNVLAEFFCWWSRRPASMVGSRECVAKSVADTWEWVILQADFPHRKRNWQTRRW